MTCPARIWPCISGAWAPAGRISTTTWYGCTATNARRARSGPVPQRQQARRRGARPGQPAGVAVTHRPGRLRQGPHRRIQSRRRDPPRRPTHRPGGGQRRGNGQKLDPTIEEEGRSSSNEFSSLVVACGPLPRATRPGPRSITDPHLTPLCPPPLARCASCPDAGGFEGQGLTSWWWLSSGLLTQQRLPSGGGQRGVRCGSVMERGPGRVALGSGPQATT